MVFVGLHSDNHQNNFPVVGLYIGKYECAELDETFILVPPVNGCMPHLTPYAHWANRGKSLVSIIVVEELINTFV